MSVKLAPRFVLFISIITSSFIVHAQDRVVVESPELKNMLQGVWAKTPYGETWIKVVVKGDRYYYYSARPQDGKWVDWTSQHEKTTLTSFLKVTERNKYDGKLFTYYVAYTDNDEYAGKYRTLRIDIENGQQVLTFINQRRQAKL